MESLRKGRTDRPFTTYFVTSEEIVNTSRTRQRTESDLPCRTTLPFLTRTLNLSQFGPKVKVEVVNDRHTGSRSIQWRDLRQVNVLTSFLVYNHCTNRVTYRQWFMRNLLPIIVSCSWIYSPRKTKQNYTKKKKKEGGRVRTLTKHISVCLPTVLVLYYTYHCINKGLSNVPLFKNLKNENWVLILLIQEWIRTFCSRLWQRTKGGVPNWMEPKVVPVHRRPVAGTLVPGDLRPEGRSWVLLTRSPTRRTQRPRKVVWCLRRKVRRRPRDSPSN